jgi:hypothetical protein
VGAAGAQCRHNWGRHQTHLNIYSCTLHEEFYRWALQGHNVDTNGVDIRHI